jgi:hypothetical protein
MRRYFGRRSKARRHSGARVSANPESSLLRKKSDSKEPDAR